MTQFTPLRNKPNLSPYSKGDVLVLFGELFQKGYANGLVEEAESRGMTIVRATVGRRDKDGLLRSLTSEETATIPTPFINVPLEAGFDLEPSSAGPSPVDLLKDVKLGDWENAKLDKSIIESSKQNAKKRFKKQVEAFVTELKKVIPANANILFAHLMAGGVPRTKIVMPLMNRAVKGTGDRYLPSEKFWQSDIGQLCANNFNEVTAETFRELIDGTSAIREEYSKKGKHVSYLAYGYHGTEILIKNQYKWQTYTPYLQGWAKMNLEKISEEHFKKGVHCCVFNCPEILTNSSNIFQGVEISLYPLMSALEKEAGNSEKAKAILTKCQSLLAEGNNLNSIETIVNNYMVSSEIQNKNIFDSWPLHSSQEHLEKMLNTSEKIDNLNKDNKHPVTFLLSEVVFKACGHYMLHESYQPHHPVFWIGHDIIAKYYQ